MTPDESYVSGPVPSVFVEPMPAPEPAPVRRGRGGGFAILALVLFGALVASTAGLMMLRSREQEDWAAIRQRLETERTAAVEKLGRLEVADAALNTDLAEARAKVEKYGAIEYQLSLIREKSDQIRDLRKAKPSYPASAYMDLSAVPEWSAPGEKLLKDFVARLDVERAKLIAFKEPKPIQPTTPIITPGKPPAGQGGQQ